MQEGVRLRRGSFPSFRPSKRDLARSTFIHRAEGAPAPDARLNNQEKNQKKLKKPTHLALLSELYTRRITRITDKDARVACTSHCDVHVGCGHEARYHTIKHIMYMCSPHAHVHQYNTIMHKDKNNGQRSRLRRCASPIRGTPYAATSRVIVSHATRLPYPCVTTWSAGLLVATGC